MTKNFQNSPLFDSPKVDVLSTVLYIPGRCGRGIEEDARHVFFACPRFELQRRKLESAFDEATTPENLV